MKIAPHLGPHGMKASYVISAPELGVPLITEVEWRGAAPGARHAHDECQMLTLLGGDMGVELHGREFALQPGAVVVIAPRLAHRVDSAAGARFLDIRFSSESSSPLTALNRLLEGQSVWHAPAKRAAELSQAFRTAYDHGGSAGTAAAFSALWKLIELMLRHAHESLRAQSRTRQKLPSDRRLAQAEGFVRDNLASALSVEGIAAHVGISRSQLSRLFERDLGTSPAAYLRDMRVRRAQKLLEGSTLSVKEVAAACGFACPHHFHRVFRESTGRTPGQVRGVKRS